MKCSQKDGTTEGQGASSIAPLFQSGVQSGAITKRSQCTSASITICMCFSLLFLRGWRVNIDSHYNSDFIQQELELSEDLTIARF